MPTALVFNPGSNSLKFELIELARHQSVASEARKLASASIDNIGKDPQLTTASATDPVSVDADSMAAAVHTALGWLRQQEDLRTPLQSLTCVGVRVVHGGGKYTAPARVTPEILTDIAGFEDLAPLHNRSSLDVLHVLHEEQGDTPTLVAFDTSFHHTLPEVAWRYPIDRAVADRHNLRKFGFHGLSHRYMLEQFAHAQQQRPQDLSLVTFHLESGCSACAIQNGRSIDTTMGLTPLEGLMMGARSGSVDPAIVPFLMRAEHQSVEDTLALLNKGSGMLGIAGGTLDTRVLVERDDRPAQLALQMFSYRVRLAAGAYLAALGACDAILLGGGIGEDSPWLRAAVCDGLTGWGVELDPAANRSTSGMHRISTDRSRLHVWAMPSDEGLQIAHECLAVLQQP